VPTFDIARAFRRDWTRLAVEQRQAFREAVMKFVTDLRPGAFRKGLRVKGVQGHPGVFEMTWAPDGRATFTFGEPVRANDPHVIWRRIGAHDIFREP
jgi:hypothetical protein